MVNDDDTENEQFFVQIEGDVWKKADVKKIIDSDRILLRAEVVTDLSSLEKDRFLCYKLVGKVNVQDNHSYFSSKGDGKRIQQRYRNLEIDGKTVKMVKGKSTDSIGLNRTILYSNDETFVVYTLDPDCEYVPPLKNSRRLTPEESGIIRDALVLRSANGALEDLGMKGLHYTKRQIYNQQKHVPLSIKSNNGPKLVTSMTKMAEMNTFLKGSSFAAYFDDKKKVREFRFIHVFAKTTELYVKQCPKIDVYQEWTDKVDRICKLGFVDREKEICKIIDQFPTGNVFKSRLWVDTTFLLCDAFVTLLLGELPTFETVPSGKPKVAILGFMVHSSKDSTQHNTFAEFFAAAFNRIDQNRRVPAVIMDGELSLKVYAKSLSAVQLRCERHLLDNMTRYCNNDPELWKQLIFGYVRNNVWRRGLVACWSESDFNVKFNKIKARDDSSNMLKWISRNKNMLIECCSATEKLKGGCFFVWNTTNAIENANKNIKLRVTKKTTADTVIKELVDEDERSFRSLIDSLTDGSEDVRFSDTAKLASMDEKEREKALVELGFNISSFLAWDVPSLLRKCLDEERMSVEDSKSRANKASRIHDRLFVVEKEKTSGDNALIIRGESFDELTCQQCKETLPEHLCEHVIAVLKILTIQERTAELIKIERKVKRINVNNLGKTHRSKSSGNKPNKRKGSTKSRSNEVRKIRRIAEVSFFETNSLGAQVGQVEGSNDDFSVNDDTTVDDDIPVDDVITVDDDIPMDDVVSTSNASYTRRVKLEDESIDSTSSFGDARRRLRPPAGSSTPKSQDGSPVIDDSSFEHSRSSLRSTRKRQPKRSFSPIY